MLEWFTGNGAGAGVQRAQSPNNSHTQTQDPPETPAPVFAVRAFKSAIFGSPGVNEDDEPTFNEKTMNKQSQKGSGLGHTSAPLFERGDIPVLRREETVPMPAPSPAKSILLTPGAGVGRRKTVSFGEGVIDNEKRKEDIMTAPTPRVPGKFPSPWSSKKHSPIKKASKFTQSLLDARTEKTSDTASPKMSSSTQVSPHVEKIKSSPKNVKTGTVPQDQEDETLNLDQPRSKSGQYWKTEFDNYQSRSNREIKNLIKYRQVAKSFARKKDAEASRLAEKLKREEAKVAEMETKVTEMAAAMAGDAEGGDVDKDLAVRHLVQQTASTLQYKHEVNHLRKTLDRHGVLGDLANGAHVEEVVNKLELSNAVEKAKKSEQELQQAKKQLSEMTGQRDEVTRLQDLVKSAERKASDLERENSSLKGNLLRIKSEMNKYEDRRKTKEDSMKQRITKLERRNRDLKDRLAQVSHERDENERVRSRRRTGDGRDEPVRSESRKHESPETAEAQTRTRRSSSSRRNTTERLPEMLKNPESPSKLRSADTSIDIWATAGNKSHKSPDTSPQRSNRPLFTFSDHLLQGSPKRPSPRRPVSTSYIPTRATLQAENSENYDDKMMGLTEDLSRSLRLSNSPSKKRISAPAAVESSSLTIASRSRPRPPSPKSPILPSSPPLPFSSPEASHLSTAIPNVSRTRSNSRNAPTPHTRSQTTPRPTSTFASTNVQNHNITHDNAVTSYTPRPTNTYNSRAPSLALDSSPRKTPLPPDREAAARERIKQKKSADLKSRRKRIVRVGEGKENLRDF